MIRRPAIALAAASAVVAGLALAGPAVASPAHHESPRGGVTHAENDRVPAGSAWTQEYFPSSDRSGTQLHADVLLPEGLKKGQKVPVILSVGPYFGHSGQTDDEGFTHTGPSARFNDFIEGSDLFTQGY
ncbi:hypothetical protein G3I76_38300, partial [Streptomyces sp. SID11233]|nr:hypothetical protein [Streptomyces sp. SID11233]